MWNYTIGTGEMVDAFGEVIGTGYSGSPAGKNNPDMQELHDVGPIPEGLWHIGHIDTEKGQITIHLSPDTTTDTFGRSGFLIHGDSSAHPGAASEGCIVLPHDVRVAISLSPDKLLYVKA